MKRKLASLLLAAIFFVFCACQQTPAQDAVIGKGDGVLEQKISEAQLREQGQETEETADPQAQETPMVTPVPYLHPDVWTEDVAMKNYLVHIEAQVRAESGNYPICRVTASDFSEMRDTVLQMEEMLIVSPDGQRDGIHTYEDYQKEMKRLTLGWFDTESYQYIPWTKDEMPDIEKEMADLTEKMQSAPREDSFAPFTGYCTAPGEACTYRDADGRTWYCEITENSLMISRFKGSVYLEKAFLYEPAQPGSKAP